MFILLSLTFAFGLACIMSTKEAVKYNFHKAVVLLICGTLACLSVFII